MRTCRLAAREGIWASAAIADGTQGDDALISAAVDLADAETVRLASSRALDARQIALKLAVLTADLLRDFDSSPESVQRLALCASALADAVAQSDGPIELPPGALSGLGEGDLVTAAKWRVRRDAANERAFGEVHAVKA